MLSQYFAPAAIGIVATALVQVASVLLQRKKITVDDNASLRQALMDERKALVAEIQGLSAKCAGLEKELHDTRERVLELERDKDQLSLTIKKLEDQVNEKTSDTGQQG